MDEVAKSHAHVDALGNGRATPSATAPTTRFSASCRGGVTRELREESAEALKAIGFEGYAIGSSCRGRGQRGDVRRSGLCAGLPARGKAALPDGVGKPDDIGAVQRGVDMMDCVLPSRQGRTGQAWTGAVRSISRTPAMPTTRGRWTRIAPARPAPQLLRAYLHHVSGPGDDFGHAADLAQPALFSGNLMAGMRGAIAAAG